MIMRTSGILLHISSLPGKEGIGTIGQGAYDFIRFLSESGVRIWQMLDLFSAEKKYRIYAARCGDGACARIWSVCPR